jgi:hypothetical protein
MGKIEKRPPSFEESLSCLTGLGGPGSSLQQARHWIETPVSISRQAKVWLSYFFLVVFFVAFFFIVLFSLGLDLDAAVPGFFFIGIRVPPIGSLLWDEHSEARPLVDYRNLLCGNQVGRREI